MTGSARRTRPRTCVGCGRVAPRAELAIRIAAGAHGAVQVGSGAPGRGAWLCGITCLEPALHRGQLDRALRHRLSGDEQAALRARLGR